MVISMIKNGDKIYNWRYGALEVSSVNGGYISAKVEDLDGIVRGDENFDKNFISSSKTFLLSTLGECLHTDFDGAIFNNNNTKIDEQGQMPYSIKLPLNGNYFHKSYDKRIKEKMSDLRSAKQIENDYAEAYKINDTILELSFKSLIKNEIKKCPSVDELKNKYKNEDEFNSKNNDNNNKINILKYLENSISETGFDFTKCENDVILQDSNEITNKEAKVKNTESIKAIINETKKMFSENEEKINIKIKELNSKVKSKNIKKHIDSKSIFLMDKVFNDEISDLLNDEKKVELSKNKLADKSYVVFE